MPAFVVTPSSKEFRKSPQRRALRVGAAVALLATVISVGAGTSPAAAFCSANNQGGNVLSQSITTTWGKETSRNSTTCFDGDTAYSGTLADIKTDGAEVQLRIKSGSSEYVQATTGSSTNYAINGSRFIRMCKHTVPIGATSSSCAGYFFHSPS